MNPDCSLTFRHIQEEPGLCARTFHARAFLGKRPGEANHTRDLLIWETHLEAMDGSGALERVANARWAGLRPPRAPCESLAAALWPNLLRVLYLHDNNVPKNELWRNGRKPGEVIGCRRGRGEGPGPSEREGGGVAVGLGRARVRGDGRWGGGQKSVRRFVSEPPALRRHQEPLSSFHHARNERCSSAHAVRRC